MLIFLAGLWITFSEFLRNEILFKSFWVNHYQNLNLKFETLPLNGILWMIWSFGLAFFIERLLKKYSVRETFLLAWGVAFPLMWITLFNLQVLPLNLLLPAIPLSFIEIAIAIFILKKFK